MEFKVLFIFQINWNILLNHGTINHHIAYKIVFVILISIKLLWFQHKCLYFAVDAFYLIKMKIVFHIRQIFVIFLFVYKIKLAIKSKLLLLSVTIYKNTLRNLQLTGWPQCVFFFKKKSKSKTIVTLNEIILNICTIYYFISIVITIK